MGRASRNKRERRRAKTAPPANTHSAAKLSRRKLALQLGLLGTVAGLIVVMILVSTKNSRRDISPSVLSASTSANGTALVEMANRYPVQPESLDELLTLLPKQLAKVDIARMNLLCASGLPSSGELDIDHALATLDRWAQRVAVETDRHLYRVTDPRYADHYGHSEPQLRAEMLAQVLQQDLGVKYNPQAIDNFSFADASVAFIHGMIPAPGQTVADTTGGTCVSMPVLYVAVGRRLGYPLKLVTTDSHIFVRWDGADHSRPAWRERFNIETTNGFSREDDDFYRNWPKPVTEREIAVNGFLQSLSPAEELAQFLAARGHHAIDMGQGGFAARCYENAYRYDPTRPCYRFWFLDAATRSGYRRTTTPALRRALLARRTPRTGSLRNIPDYRPPQPNAAKPPGVATNVIASRPEPSSWHASTQPRRDLSPTAYYSDPPTPE